MHWNTFWNLLTQFQQSNKQLFIDFLLARQCTSYNIAVLLFWATAEHILFNSSKLGLQDPLQDPDFEPD